MLFMVTSRRKKGGNYGSEEQANYGYDYLYEHDKGQQGKDGFNKTGKRGFKLELQKALKAIRDSGVTSTPKVGIYLHGFNNDWHESIDEIHDFDTALTGVIGYSPIIVGFSWPSSGSTFEYVADRQEARDSAPAFVRFLGDINDFLKENEQDCFATSYCIAHSMGNYLLRKGMEYLSDSLGTPIGRCMFNETVLLAPDISSKDIELDGKGRYIADFSRRVHVYYSRHDRALKASSAKRFGGDRLGRQGADDYDNLAPNTVVIDAQNFANKEEIEAKDLKVRGGERVSVHSSHRYHPNILADVVQVLSSVDRDLIPNREVIPDDSGMIDSRPNHYRLTE